MSLTGVSWLSRGVWSDTTSRSVTEGGSSVVSGRCVSLSNIHTRQQTSLPIVSTGHSKVCDGRVGVLVPAASPI